MIRTGIPILDDILKGGIREENSILLMGGIDEDHRVLMHQFVISLLKQRHKILLVEYKQRPSLLLKWLTGYGINYKGFMKRGRLKILDGHTNLYSRVQVSGKDVLPNPLDLPISTSIIRDKISEGDFDFLVIDDLSILYASLPGKQEFFKVISRFINGVSLEGVTSVSAIIGDLISPSDLSMLTIPFPYILSARDGRIVVKKAPHPLGAVNYFIYVKTEKGIKPISEYHESLDKLKESMFLDENGMLWSANQRVQIINEESEAKLIESLFEYFGKENAQKFLYFWGKHEFHGVGKLYMQRYGNLKESLKRMFHSTKVNGGGIMELSQTTGDVIIVKAENLFPRVSNFGNAVHLHDVGALTRIIEEIEGGEWIGEEVKCQAKGDPHCEFVIRRVER